MSTFSKAARMPQELRETPKAGRSSPEIQKPAESIVEPLGANAILEMCRLAGTRCRMSLDQSRAGQDSAVHAALIASGPRSGIREVRCSMLDAGTVVPVSSGPGRAEWRAPSEHVVTDSLFRLVAAGKARHTRGGPMNRFLFTARGGA